MARYGNDATEFIFVVNLVRVKKHVSLDDLSAITHIDKSNLSKIFNGKISPSLRTTCKILDALDLRITLKNGFLYPYFV